MERKRKILREDFNDYIDHPGTVAIFFLNSSDELLMVSVSREESEKQWEIPGGIRNRNEDNTIAIQRELEEETGYHIDLFAPLCKFTTSSGITNEIVTIFFYKGQVPENRNSIAEHESNFFSISTVEKMIKNGEVMDARTVLSFFWYKFYNLD